MSTGIDFMKRIMSREKCLLGMFVLQAMAEFVYRSINLQ